MEPISLRSSTSSQTNHPFISISWRPMKCQCANQLYNNGSGDHSRPNRDASMSNFIKSLELYTRHKESLELESKLSKKICDIIGNNPVTTRNEESRWKDVYLELRQSRLLLMHLIAWTTFLKPSNQSEIIKANQRDFQSAIEELSSVLDNDLSNSNLTEIKPKVFDKATICKRRREHLLEHINEGYEKDWWSFNDAP